MTDYFVLAAETIANMNKTCPRKYTFYDLTKKCLFNSFKCLIPILSIALV